MVIPILKMHIAYIFLVDTRLRGHDSCQRGENLAVGLLGYWGMLDGMIPACAGMTGGAEMTDFVCFSGFPI